MQKLFKLNRYATLKMPPERTETRNEYGEYISPVNVSKIIHFAILEREQESESIDSTGSRVGNEMRVVIRFNSGKNLLAGNINMDDYRFVYNEIEYEINSVSEYLHFGRKRFIELFLTKAGS